MRGSTRGRCANRRRRDSAWSGGTVRRLSLAILFTGISGIEHVYFFALEALLWRKPLGLKTFRMDAAKAETTAQLAVNQGFYNLFLAAGLFWAAASGDITL